MSMRIGKLFSLTGGALGVYALYKLFDFAYLHFVRPSSLPRYIHAPGGRTARPWALVTGASDGIGKGFAEELCFRGFNVILHGRNEEKLNKVQEELLTQWPDRLVRIIVIDAHHVSNDIAIEGLAMALKEVYITVLINNIGGAGPVHPAWKELHKRTGKEVDAFIDVNLRFSTHITRALLPILMRNTPSLVLNVGSIAGDIPTAYATVYSGAKAYNMAWSRSLKAEMVAEDKDVEVLGILVGTTQSGHEKRETSFFVPSSRRLACAALDKVGCGRAIVTAFPPHAMQKTFVNLMPPSLLERMVIKVAKEEKKMEEKQR
jgi:17beta-estradiol 17-dehydrogenase / very-long-chain 3-oxoacyl-CoA reductase